MPEVEFAMPEEEVSALISRRGCGSRDAQTDASHGVAPSTVGRLREGTSMRTGKRVLDVEEVPRRKEICCFLGRCCCCCMLSFTVLLVGVLVWASRKLPDKFAAHGCVCAWVVDRSNHSWARDAEGRCPAASAGDFAKQVVALKPDGDLDPQQVCLVTGGTSGIGHATARALAEVRCSRIYITSRELSSAKMIARSISEDSGNPEVYGLELELSNLASVKSCAEKFLERERRLDILVLNAGAFVTPSTAGLTTDGYEFTFQVNYLGHFLFYRLLVPAIRRSKRPSVTSVSSGMHSLASSGRDWGTDDDWASLRKPTVYSPLTHDVGMREYGVSKLAQIFFTQALAESIDGLDNAPRIVARALHPGGVGTKIYRAIPWPLRKWITSEMFSWEEGSRTVVWAALASVEPKSCPWAYFESCKCKTPSSSARDVQLRHKMWNYSLMAVRNFTGL